MTFGQRLITARENKGYSQRGLAEALGITPTRLNYWEKDKRQPDVPMIKLLAETLGVSSDYLIGNQRGNAPGITPEALQVASDYDGLPPPGQRLVRVVIDELKKEQMPKTSPPPATRIIPLLGSRFAAGIGEPDYGNALEEYEVACDSKADFAVRVNGDSMEPYLPDGSIQLGAKGSPKDGDVVAIAVDGAFYIKQIYIDSYGNMRLFSLNRARANLDVTVWASAESNVNCFGTIIMPERVPLPHEITLSPAKMNQV